LIKEICSIIHYTATAKQLPLHRYRYTATATQAQ